MAQVEQQTNTTTNLAALHFEPLISGRKECCETTEFCQSTCTNKQSLSRAFDPTNNLEQRCSIAHRLSVLSYIYPFFHKGKNLVDFSRPCQMSRLCHLSALAMLECPRKNSRTWKV
eukprot:g71050.t1